MFCIAFNAYCVFGSGTLVNGAGEKKAKIKYGVKQSCCDMLNDIVHTTCIVPNGNVTLLTCATKKVPNDDDKYNCSMFVDDGVLVTMNVNISCSAVDTCLQDSEPGYDPNSWLFDNNWIEYA